MQNTVTHIYITCLTCKNKNHKPSEVPPQCKSVFSRSRVASGQPALACFTAQPEHQIQPGARPVLPSVNTYWALTGPQGPPWGCDKWSREQGQWERTQCLRESMWTAAGLDTACPGTQKKLLWLNTMHQQIEQVWKNRPT